MRGPGKGFKRRPKILSFELEDGEELFAGFPG